MLRVQRSKVAAISTRWIRRVAAPCVCFVPWAALASCRPLPQQLLPVSATGGGRRRCTFFSLLRFVSPSAAAAAAPRRGAGAPSPSPSVTPCPFLSLCDIFPRPGEVFQRERQEAFPPRSWLSLRESWREAPERVRSPAGRDRRKIKIIFPLNIAQSEAEGILNPVFVVLKSQNPEKPAQKRLKAVQKRFWMCYTNK